MAEIIRLPRMSDTMVEGNIVMWHKKVGDKVNAGDVLADIETDKATMEFESYQDGVLLHIAVPKGKVAVDGIIAVIGKKGEDFKHLLKGDAMANISDEGIKEKADTVQSTQANETTLLDLKKLGVKLITMPLLSDTMQEGKIVAWHKKVGDKVNADDVLADVETDKATMELVGYEEGTILYQGKKVGESAKINEVIAIIGDSKTPLDPILKQIKTNAVISQEQKETSPVPLAKQPEVTQAPIAEEYKPLTGFSGRVKASPLARRIAKEKGIDLRTIKGSGDEGRVIKKDLENISIHKATPAVFGTLFEELPVTSMRKVIAQRLTKSVNTAPHFYLTTTIDMGAVSIARKKINELHKSKVSFNDIVLKATALALIKHPMVNASWYEETIRVHKEINIAVAVAVEDGLLVPVIRNADTKSLLEISTEVKNLVQKAKDKKLQPFDWEGNTFTISNLGMFGVDSFTAIINSLDAAILAVGAIIEKPIVKNGQIVVGNIMKVTMSGDHRVIDGAVGAAFLQTLKAYLEEPLMML